MNFECIPKGDVAEIVMHSDARGYFFDRESIQDLTDIISDIKNSVQKIRIKSFNQRIFSLGFDPDQFRFDVKSFEDIRYGLSLGQKLIREIYSAAEKFECQIEGLCLGAGFEFALACGKMNLSNAAKLKFSEYEIGLFPSYGGFYLMAKKYGNNFALEHMYRTRFLRKKDFSRTENGLAKQDEIQAQEITKILEASNLEKAQELSTDLFVEKVKVKYNR